jgi:hypothetical protein
MNGLEEWLPLVRKGEHRNRLTHRAGLLWLQVAEILVGLRPLVDDPTRMFLEGVH